MMAESSPKPAKPFVLTINGGSSSIKFALYPIGGTLKRSLHGKVDRIGLPGANLTFNDPTRNQQESRSIEASDHRSAADFLIDWLEEQLVSLRSRPWDTAWSTA
jgi:acetate kinase